jgi:diphthamide synthase (EF-2-diphthine--ammonia ligase)
VNGLFPCLDESLVEKQAESLRLPLRVFRLSGKKQAELLELQEAFSQLERDYGIRGMVIGDSVPRPRFSQLDALCRVLGIQLLAPLLEERKETIALNESSAVGAVSDEPVPCSSVQSSGSGSAREAVARKAVA